MTNKNNITELVFILDRSGSMAGLESDTIGGFNSLIEKQKKEDGECFVTTVLFDHEYFLLHDRVRLSEIRTLTDKDYQVRGCTALIDAIGKSVKHIEQIHRYQREEDVPAHTMFVITTDGLENASKKFSSDEVKKLIEQHKEKDNWEFLFIGANIDAVETARHFGISEDRSVNYHADTKGTGVLYAAVADAVSSVRSKGRVKREWSRPIAEDYEDRKK
ncbi:MAG: VWA domain-containing protein [Ruminococcus sp.]|nr:VWA domain-containing protein [Ruminococcus sp.]